MLYSKHLTVLVGLLSAGVTQGSNVECAEFKDIYADGKELCETMWGDSFVYEEDEANAYSMWFFDAVNPNDAVSAAFNHPANDQCHLQYNHKDVPGPEPDNYMECHPFKDDACCQSDTVQSVDAINTAYGSEYHWDRCGQLSPACERFMVQEACFYECDPNAGHYRKWPEAGYDENNEDHNRWEVHQMPIKASYCNAWHRACYHDSFCAQGNFYSCAIEYEKEAEAAKADKELPSGAIALIVIGSIAFLATCGVLFFIINKEKSGQPVFTPLETTDDGESRRSQVVIAGSGTKESLARGVSKLDEDHNI